MCQERREGSCHGEPGGWERRWGVRGDGHGSSQRGPAAPGGCVSLPSTPFPGQGGSVASACELEMALTSARPRGGRTCWAPGRRQGSLPGSTPPQPGWLPASVSFSPSCGVRATAGHISPSPRSCSQLCRGAPGLPPAPTKTVHSPTSLSPVPRARMGRPLDATAMGRPISKTFPTS